MVGKAKVESVTVQPLSHGKTTYSLVREGISRDSLGLHTLHETDVRSEDRDPGQRTKDGDRSGEVVECLESVLRSDDIGETHEASGESESDVWDTSGSTSSEDLWCVSVLGHTVEGSSSDVLVRVGGRESKDEDTATGPSGLGSKE